MSQPAAIFTVKHVYKSDFREFSAMCMADAANGDAELAASWEGGGRGEDPHPVEARVCDRYIEETVLNLGTLESRSHLCLNPAWCGLPLFETSTGGGWGEVWRRGCGAIESIYMHRVKYTYM